MALVIRQTKPGHDYPITGEDAGEWTRMNVQKKFALKEDYSGCNIPEKGNFPINKNRYKICQFAYPFKESEWTLKLNLVRELHSE